MACSPMSGAVPPLQTPSRRRQQVPFGSGLTGLQWRFSQSGAVWWSANVASQPQPRELQDDAASQLYAASTGSRRGLHYPQWACQGRGGEWGEEEVDCVGKPVAKKQHINSFSMGPAQHKQFHYLMAIPHQIRHSSHQIWGPLHQAGVTCAWMNLVHASSSMQAAMQQGVVAPAPAPAPAPAEDFEEQTVEESDQHWAAISTWE